MTAASPNPDDVLWQPSAAQIKTTEIARWCAALDLPISYAELHRWSVENPEAFWERVWDRFEVIGDRTDDIITRGDRFRTTRFFPGASLNVAENLLAGKNVDPATHTAMTFNNELGHQRSLTLHELRELVSVLQQAMRRVGVGVGDVVAAWLPNIPETMAIFLAANSLGAIFTSSSPDFGVAGVVDRFSQINPKLLFATDEYLYAGKAHDTTERLAEIQGQLPTVESTIMVPYLNSSATNAAPVGTISVAEFTRDLTPKAVTFTRVEFDHPIFVLFSSGTTGAPKAIVHRSGGVLLKLLSEHKLHCNIAPGDRVFYFTTAGWMMWNWLVMTLACEATVVLFDGSPFHPQR